MNYGKFIKNIRPGYLLITVFLFFAGSIIAQQVDPTNLRFEYLTLEDGLPNNKVNAVSMDKNGFMWFGTNDGICRYDGLVLKYYPLDNLSGNQARTSQISVIKTSTDGNLLIGSYSLFRYNYSADRIEKCDTSKSVEVTGRVYAIEEGNDGEIWIGSENGLFSYNAKNDRITPSQSEKGKKYLIISILIDEGKLWIGTRKDGLLVYDIKTRSYSKVPRFISSTEVKDNVNCFYKDKDGIIWAGTQDNGIFKFNTSDSSQAHIFPDPGNSLSYRVRKIINDKYGNVWVGCRLGIFLQSTGSETLTFINQADDLPSRSRSNSIYDIYIDSEEIIWTGTFSFGASYANLRRKPFRLYRLTDKENTVAPKMINCFSEGREGNIWIGTEENSLYSFNRRNNLFKQYKPEGAKSNSPAGENVKALAKLSNGDLWIGYYSSGLDYFVEKSGKFINYRYNADSPSSIASNAMRSLAIDDSENLWIATDKGVDFLKAGTEAFRHYNLNAEVLTLHIDSKKRVWAGSAGDGIYILDTAMDEFIKIYPDYFTTSIKSILVDSHSNLWVGTNKGLYYIITVKDSVIYTGIDKGLPSNAILDILEDNSQNIWVSTGGGLVKCEGAVKNPMSFTIKQFGIHDGLQGTHFREFAAYKSTSGEFYFGGTQGFNIFTPDSIMSNPFPPKLAFTNLKIFNKNVEIGEKIKGETVLEKSLNETKLLTLSYQHTSVSIEFIALHYSNPLNTRYRFRLDPLEKEWNYSTGIRNFASYSKLVGRDYQLIVEAANDDGLWSPQSLILKIKVIPPFWKTIWFSALIIILISALAIGYYRFRISLFKKRNTQLEKKVEDRTHKLKESFNAVIEKQNLIEEQSVILMKQKEQLQELISIRDKFFSIIAHDLRSPFQSLLGLSEILLDDFEKAGNPEQKSYAQAIYNSSNNIYSLVENLLIWSRSQSNKLTLTPGEINLSVVIENILSLLEPHFNQKEISLEKTLSLCENGYADRNMIEMVLRNLITNAIKFTPEKGRIYVSLKTVNKNIQVEIRDTGIGISNEDQKKLFRLDESFSRKGTNGENGTGLGLIICKEFLEKNNGEIWVKSNVGEGSSFFFTIPSYQQIS